MIVCIIIVRYIARMRGELSSQSQVSFIWRKGWCH